MESVLLLQATFQWKAPLGNENHLLGLLFNMPVCGPLLSELTAWKFFYHLSPPNEILVIGLPFF